MRRGPVLLVFPAGVLLGHALAYAAAGHVHSPAGGIHSHVGHGYLSLAAAVAAPLALAGLLLGAVEGRLARIALWRLCLLQWVAFLLQEAGEHLLAGDALTAVLTSPPVWYGLLAQALLALAATVLLRAAATAGVRLLGLLGAPSLLAAAPGWHSDVSVAVPVPLLRRTATPRGPPLAAG